MFGVELLRSVLVSKRLYRNVGWLAVGAATVAALTGSALAQDEAVDDGFYLRVGAGATLVSDWDQEFAFSPDPGGASLNCNAGGPCAAVVIAPPAGQAVSNDKGWVGAAAIGFDYADGIRTELEYRFARSTIDGLSLSDTQAYLPHANASDDVEAHLLMSNFYFDFHNSSAFTPFIGGGVGGAFVSSEQNERDAALAVQGRAGVSVEAGGVSFDLEYIYLRSNELEFSRTESFHLGEFDITTTGDRYQSSSVMVSLRKQF